MITLEVRVRGKLLGAVEEVKDAAFTMIEALEVILDTCCRRRRY